VPKAKQNAVSRSKRQRIAIRGRQVASRNGEAAPEVPSSRRRDPCLRSSGASAGLIRKDLWPCAARWARHHHAEEDRGGRGTGAGLCFRWEQRRGVAVTSAGEMEQRRGVAVTSAGENKQADAAYLGEGETLRQGGPPDASAGGSRAAGARGRRRVLGDQHPEHGGEAVAGGGDPPTITVAEVTSLCWFPSSAARQLAPGFDAWQTGREPQPVGRLAADPAELAAQHRVLVLDYQDFGILAPLRASRQTAEQAGARAGRRPRRSLSGDPTHSTAQGGPDRVIDRRTLQAPKRRALRQAGQRRECPTVDTLFWVGEIVTVVSR